MCWSLGGIAEWHHEEELRGYAADKLPKDIECHKYLQCAPLLCGLLRPSELDEVGAVAGQRHVDEQEDCDEGVEALRHGGAGGHAAGEHQPHIMVPIC